MNDKWVSWIITAAVLIAAIQDPKCNRGCKTVAEHILNHVIGDMITAALA